VRGVSDVGIRRSGHWLAPEAVQPVQTPTTVRVRNGEVAITDGPFAGNPGTAGRVLFHRGQGLE
jgi:hypothetical protein